MDINEPLAALGGRKFIIAILALGFSFGLTIASSMSTDQFIDLVRWVMGLYIVGNVGSEVTKKLG